MKLRLFSKLALAVFLATGFSPSKVIAHATDQSWIVDHRTASFDCTVCHGADYHGTPGSRTSADRTFSTVFGTKNFWKGYQIGCYTCHNGPGGSGVAPASPVVSNVTATVSANGFKDLALTPSPGSAVVRIVTSAAHGNVSLSGNTARYTPNPGYSGGDTFTFAARDASNSVDSNLGQVTITVSAAAVSLVWAGDGSTNKWDAGITADWLRSGMAAKFQAGAAVLFGDTGSNVPAINLIGSLAPSSVNITAVKNYTFGGAGSLVGATPLTKAGTGMLTLTGTYSYRGPTRVNAGTLTISGLVASSTTLYIAPVGTVNVGVRGRVNFSGPITNAGNLRVAAGGSFHCNGILINSGVLTVPKATVLRPSNLVNTGVVVDASSLPVISFAKTGTTVLLRARAAAGHHYRLQRTTWIPGSTWLYVGAAQAGTGGILTFSDLGGVTAAGSRVYRIVTLP